MKSPYSSVYVGIVISYLFAKFHSGHFCVKHTPSSVALSVQFFPSKLGEGLSHFLARLRVPPPQVRLHAVHVSQDPQLPSENKKKHFH